MPTSSRDGLRDARQAEEMLASAIAHQQKGRMQEAERLYRSAIGIVPGHVSALYRLGMLCVQEGRAGEAVDFLEAASRERLQNSSILNGLGVALQLSGRSDEAEARFRQALAITPGDADILANLVKMLLTAGRHHYEKSEMDQAILSFEKAVDLAPDNPNGLVFLGRGLWAAGRYKEAGIKLRQSLQIRPRDPATALNIGELMYDEGDMREAIKYFDLALDMDPNFKIARWRKSFALLATGEYSLGWTLYAEALGGSARLNLFAPQAPWDGSPAADKHLLIWCEQGLGDAIQFIRYARLCKKRVKKISVLCHPTLIRLFGSIAEIDQVFDVCDRRDFDEHLPIMNLPHVFDTVLETIPSEVPYLAVDAETKALWAKKFENAGGLKVGLAWAGGKHSDNVLDQITDRQRSLALRQLMPLFDVPGVTFYSLQKETAAGESDTLKLEDRLIHFMGDVKDFADTAAIIENLDLVISVDTSVAHLAGALGKPVWIMSRFNADWRWLQNRPANPWYPSARLFGQPRMGDWNSVITEVVSHLRHMAAGQ